MKTPVSPQLNIIIPAFRAHSQTFLMLLEGISEEDALRRVNGVTNHLFWMAGNFVNARYGIGNLLGMVEKDPFEHLFYMGKALDESLPYPTLDELKKSFYEVSPGVIERLLNASDDFLGSAFPTDMGISFIPEDVLNMVGMLIGREDYLSGQMGLMRRILGYSSPSYRFDYPIEF